MNTHFFHFLCNRLIIRDAILCFLYLYISIGAMDKDRVCVETPIFLFVYCIPFFLTSVGCNTIKRVKIRKCSFLNCVPPKLGCFLNTLQSVLKNGHLPKTKSPKWTFLFFVGGIWGSHSAKRRSQREERARTWV